MTIHHHLTLPAHGPDAGDQHVGHQQVGHGAAGGLRAMAASATLHCLTGCAIGEILGMLIGTAAGLTNAVTIGLSVALAFVFGYTLSALPLLRSGLPVRRVLTVVLAADTLSIATMEVVDNAVMAVIPGAMEAGLVNLVFWGSMALALTAAFAAAFPVNLVLLGRGRGHALTHEFHGAAATPDGWRRFVPAVATPTLAAAIAAFLAGGAVVSLAELLG